MSERGSVFIDDDDEANEGQLQKLLKSDGYTVKRVASDKDALESLKACSPNLVLLSAHLSQANPFDLPDSLKAGALFIFIGAVPGTRFLGELVEHDEAGFIYTGQDLVRNGRRPKNWKPKRDPFLLETSVPGIFAAGDVRHGVIRRVASAVGQGAVAVSLVHKYLETV